MQEAEAGPVQTNGPKIAAPARASAAKSPWYGQLWQSMVIADASVRTPVTVAPANGQASVTPSPTK